MSSLENWQRADVKFIQSIGVAITDMLQEMNYGWNISDIQGHLNNRDNATNIFLGAELANIESEISNMLFQNFLVLNISYVNLLLFI